MEPLMLGLAGKAECGKTIGSRIITEWVEQQNGGKTAIVELSGLILEECWELGLIPNGQPRDGKNAEQNKIIIEHGRVRREADENYWMNQVIKKMCSSGADVAICPNIRFPLEAKAIKAAGGVNIKINRLNADGSPFISTTRDPNGVTETILDLWRADFHIYNMTGHGTLFQNQMWELIDYIIGQQQ